MSTHTYVYTHVKQIDTVLSDIASEFAKDNISEGPMRTFSTTYEILSSLLSGHFYVCIWIREKTHVFLDNNYCRTIVQPLT